MRNFEERMEEIQRRSEKIIKQRKKRRLCMATACVPAVLCAAFLLHRMLPGDAMEPDFYNGAVMESYTDMSQSAAYVEVSGSGMRKNLTEPETVNQIIQLMSPAIPETNVLEDSESFDLLEAETVYKEDLMDDSKDYSTSSAVVYIITVCQPDGETVSYSLVGNQLECDSGEVRILTSQELQELQMLLEITQEGETK